MNWFRREEWAWWQAGLLLGLLNMAAFFTADYYLSVSTTFSRAAGMVVGIVAPEHVAANAYWQKIKRRSRSGWTTKYPLCKVFSYLSEDNGGAIWTLDGVLGCP